MRERTINRILITACLLAASAVSLHAQRGFAIVVDPKSYEEAKGEITRYAAAIESAQGLKVDIVTDRWGVPDSIRSEVKRMHARKKHPIEGAVFVGDIPIPMIRDAQHLTSAFKMDQRMNRQRSSVPSDRYYDDFGLTFSYIDRDKDVPYFYYSLTASSRQYLQPDIYTGRIRPTDCNGISRYEKLRNYLNKVVAAKQEPANVLDQMLFFSGHGYISESFVARIDEKQGLYEHFPWLKRQQNGIGFIDHSREKVIKFRLMNELMRPDLDYAILHHHGYWNTQYLSGLPKVRVPMEAKDMIRSYSRAQVRAAKKKGLNTDSVMQKMERRFDIPHTWLSDTFEADVCRNDSVNDADMDLHLEDFAQYDYRPNCRVVMLDACFCGSFHREDCIANEYIFSSGKNIACIANTVNVLQDKWSDRYMGLLGLGVCVGDVARYSGYLESHVIGDPTFTFAPAVKTADINALLASGKPSDWKRLLKNSNLPELQCMAIGQLKQDGELSSNELLHIFSTSPYAIVRIEALVSLATFRDDCFIEAIKLAVDDSHEMVQRFGLRFLGQSGDERLIPSLIKVCIANNTSERSNFNAINALSFYPVEKLIPEFEKQFNTPDLCYVNKQQVGETIRRAIRSAAGKWVKSTLDIIRPETPEKERRLNIRGLRNYCPHALIPNLLSYIRTSDNSEVQIMLLEALGWHKYSYMAPQVAALAHELSEDPTAAEQVRYEALKTYNRLK